MSKNDASPVVHNTILVLGHILAAFGVLVLGFLIAYGLNNPGLGFVLVVAWLYPTYYATWTAHNRRGGCLAGFLLGLHLGWLGVAIVLVLPGKGDPTALLRRIALATESLDDRVRRQAAVRKSHQTYRD
jgi:hypothetical protein